MGLLDALRDPQFRSDVGTNTRNLFQQASNNAASNVTAPIDIMAWLLRKGGVPVPQNPMGGSEWAKDAGFTREVPDGAPKVAGDTLGMLALLLGAGKSKEIAGGLLKGEEAVGRASTNQLNKWAEVEKNFPARGNSQRGAVVYHGSPHKFDRFDASKIGTGEGAQAYGHGLYLAESPEVALQYSNIRAAPNMEFHAGGKKLSGLEKAIADDLTANGKAVAMLNAKANGPEWLAAYERIANEPVTRGAVYKVDLPDTAIARMLDWDKPLSQQAPGVTESLSRIAQSKNPQMARYWRESVGMDDAAKTALRKRLGINIFDTIDQGGAAYQSLGGSAENALRQAGIPGIRYLDQGSRGAGQGTSNFVVFPGEESMLKILLRNGQPLP
jgi:hypothetical protein